MPPSSAVVTVVLPTATPDNQPVGVIVAVLSSFDVHVKESLTSYEVLSLYVAVAINCRF